MKRFRFLTRRTVASFASLALLLGMAAPALVPAFASADNISSRSISMSTSAAAATGVEYTVTFTPTHSADGFILDFCNNTPLPGEACTAPTGFSTLNVEVGGTTPTATVTNLATSSNGVRVVDTLTAGQPYTVVLSDITNPTDPTDGTANNGFYGRIVSYATANLPAAATGDNSTLGTDPVDQGGVALAITQAIGVQAAVRESMVFCVSGAQTTADVSCAGANSTAPDLTLGVSSGNSKALSTSEVSPGTIYTQLSTNAAGGAVVNLTSDAKNCGGLLLNHDTTAAHCYIGPADSTANSGTGNLVPGAAFFGLTMPLTSTSTTGAEDPVGTIAPESGYGPTIYNMDFASDNSTGVTSPYGTPVMSTDTAVNNQNMPITFGASINNNTPAGLYSADLGLIATGTF